MTSSGLTGNRKMYFDACGQCFRQFFRLSIRKTYASCNSNQNFKKSYCFLFMVVFSQAYGRKGPVKLMQRVNIAYSFFTVSAKSVARYHFKLAYVVRQMTVKEFFETHV